MNDAARQLVQRELSVIGQAHNESENGIATLVGEHPSPFI